MEQSSTLQWLVGDASAVVVESAANVLVQSTLLIAAGLLASALLRRRGAAVQSAVLRATLVAVIACPLASWLLGTAGFGGWGVRLPVLETEVAAAGRAEMSPSAIPVAPSPAPPPLSEGGPDTDAAG